VDDLGAADVALELDLEPVGAQRLAVELAQQELFGEVLRADPQPATASTRTTASIARRTA
jgi:hypothetical protein